MPPEPARAEVVHRLPGRLRLVVPAERGVQAYFDRLALALATLRGVQSVRTSARAASVVIRHAGAADDILEAAHLEGLLRAAPPRAPTEADDALKAARTRARPPLASSDVDRLLVLGFAAAGLIQLLRGQVLPPALSLFSYALALERGGLASAAHPHEESDGDG